MRFLIALFAILAATFAAHEARSQTLPEPGEWLEIPGTELRPHVPTSAEIGAERGSKPGHVNPWIGFAYREGTRTWYDILPGGHRDYGGSDSYSFSFDDLDWTREQPFQELTFPNPYNPTQDCPWPADETTFPSFHTYDGVSHIEGGRFILFGFEPFCVGENMNPSAFTLEVDTSTEPWTYTHLPHLKDYAVLAASAVHDGRIYVVTKSGDWAVIDATTYEIIRSGVTGGPGKGLAAMDVVGDEICYGTPTWIRCAAPDEFGSGLDAFRHNLGRGLFGLTGLPDGRAAIWLGNGDVYTYDPNTQELVHIAPAQPLNEMPWEAESDSDGVTKLIYSKWQFIPHLSDADNYIVAGYNSLDHGVWLYNVPGSGVVPDPDPDPDPEPTGTDRLDCTVSPMTYPEGELPPSFNLNLSCEVTTTEADPDPDPDPANTATADFADRCAAPGVFFCQGFNDPIPESGDLPERVALTTSGDNAVMPQVENGYVQMTYLSESGQSMSGYYFIDWTEAGLEEPIGPGDSLYIQWRQYMPASYLETVFRHENGSRTKPKALIVSVPGGPSCTPTHVVMTSNNLAQLGEDGPDVTRTTLMYNRCRPSQIMRFQGDTQPICDVGPGARDPGTCETRRLPEDEARWDFPKDQWVTYQIGIDLDPVEASYIAYSGREVWNGHVRLWAQVDGGEPVLVMDYVHQFSAFYSEDRTIYRPWGRVYLIAFMTKKDKTQVHPDTFTRYDELVIGRQRIPDPT